MILHDPKHLQFTERQGVTGTGKREQTRARILNGRVVNVAAIDNIPGLIGKNLFSHTFHPVFNASARIDSGGHCSVG